MKKIETIWHYILQMALEKDIYRFTQQEIAQKFDFSLSTVNHAVKIPTEMGALRKESKFFILQDFKKLLYYWASIRNLEKDIIYKTYVAEPVTQIEGIVPANSVYAGFSSYIKKYGEPPADYSKVYFYFDEKELRIVKERFPENPRKEPNIFILKMPKHLIGEKSSDIIQTYVDIWNMRYWYAKEFIKSLEDKMYGVLS